MIPSISTSIFWKTVLFGLYVSIWIVQSDSVGPPQNPVVSCHDGKKKILCLSKDYSKFDLPYRKEYNVIDIGKLKNTSEQNFRVFFSIPFIILPFFRFESCPEGEIRLFD
jgi:hypothetical protein